jgi:transcriptional regulator with XRE-family HTH domain
MVMAVNKKIHTYIKEQGISQAELAKRTGIAQQNLNRLLAADDIKVSQLIDITKALELPVTYFFDGKEHISNEEIQGDKKRIAELEEMLGDKRRIIAEIEKNEVEQVKKLLNDVIENEYKTLSPKDKKEAYKIVIEEAKNATNGRSFFYDLNKRSEIVELIQNDLLNPREFTKEDSGFTVHSDFIAKQTKKTQRKTRKL